MIRYYCDKRSILSFLFFYKSGGAGLFLYDTKPPRLVSPNSKRGVMTKSLEQIQQENRKFILEAIHGCSYEEALKKELSVGCKVKIKRFMSTQDFNEEIFVIDDYCDFFNESFFKTTDSHRHNEIIEIIGKPLTLSRVLLALKDEEIGFYDNCLGEVWKGRISNWGFYGEDRPPRLEYVCDWDLKKETLEEQSEETQRKINKLFNNIKNRNNK